MWKKINHGGEPTKNIDKKYAIFVGRYQPYHFGHIELIKQKLNQGIPALIMVRNIEPLYWKVNTVFLHDDGKC